MNYSEAQQKRILREMEKDLLALPAVDVATSCYEVLYSDGSYNMTVYYNALRRLKLALQHANIGDLLISTPRGQMDLTPLDTEKPFV